MRLEVKRNRLWILPDRNDERDIAYIEEVLGLKEDGDFVKAIRVNAHNLSCIAYIEVTKSS